MRRKALDMDGLPAVARFGADKAMTFRRQAGGDIH
jgi:hypothetical protein